MSLRRASHLKSNLLIILILSTSIPVFGSIIPVSRFILSTGGIIRMRSQTRYELTIEYEDLIFSGYTAKDLNTMELIGVNHQPWVWYDWDKLLAEYEKGLVEAKKIGFNTIRFFTTLIMARLVKEPRQLTVEDIENVTPLVREFVAILKAYPHFKYIPTLASEGLFKQFEVLDEVMREWVDLWLAELPEDYVYAWDLCNEPPDNVNPDTLINLANYLKNKTSKPLTIGYHMDRMSVFQSTVEVIDIISYHFYPYKLLFYGKNPYEEFTKKLEWLDSYNRPYIIGEFGLEGPQEPNLEPHQKAYFANILHIMKQRDSDNLKGYAVWVLWGDGKEWNILNQDFTHKPVVDMLP